MTAYFINSQRWGAKPAVGPVSVPRNQVIHGDCIQVMSEWPSGTVDLVLTDPPYLINYRDRCGRTVANDNQASWVKPAFAKISRVLKPDSFCISFYGWGHVDTFMAAWRDAGLKPVGHLAFVKDYASSNGYLSSHHEVAFLLAKGRPEKPAGQLTNVQSWQYTGNRLHPTQKPVSPLRPLIERFCPPNGVVLDPFCGSGSTLVAAQECGRGWLGIELDADHYATASDRCDL